MQRRNLVNRNNAYYLKEWGGEIAGIAVSTLFYIFIAVLLVTILISWRWDWDRQEDNKRDIEAEAEKEFRESDYFK